MEQDLPLVSLTNETARREFLIAPVLMEAVHQTQSRIQVEVSGTSGVSDSSTERPDA